MKDTAKKITDYIAEQSMLRSGDKVLCAVSGGADSMCLLHFLSSAADELGIDVFAAHYEHGIRGEESLRDCAFVEKWCAEAGIPCAAEHGDVPRYAADNSLGTEEAARRLRYEFLERAAAGFGCGVIATAHNMEDNAETVLFNLARGAGTAGVAGIPPVRGNIIRPLLCLRRAEVLEYLDEHSVPHVEDSTNLSDDYSRNRIRHRVIPELCGAADSPVEAIFRASAIAREDESCLSHYAEEFIRKHGAASIPASELLREPPAVRKRILRQMCPQTLSMQQTDSLMAMLSSTEIRQLSLPGATARIEQGVLRIIRNEGAPDASDEAVSEKRIPLTEIVPGTVAEFPGAGIKISCEETVFREDVHGLFNILYLKCGEINGRIFCSSRMNGDSLRVSGRGCTKTLKSLFTEAHMTQSERDAVPVFRDDSGVLAAAGLAVAERSVCRDGDRALKITIDRI